MVCHDIISSFNKAIFFTHGLVNKISALYQTLQLLAQYPPKFAFYLVNNIAWTFFDSYSMIVFVNAVASILTILLVFIIGRKFFNLRIGIISSTLFSFSLIYLRYSRNGFSMVLTYLFLVLSVYYYLNFISIGRTRYLAIAGQNRNILSDTLDPLSAILRIKHMDFDKVKEFTMNFNTSQKNYVLEGVAKPQDLAISKKIYKTAVLEAEISRKDKNPYHKTKMSMVLLKRGTNIPILIEVFASGLPVSARLVDVE